MAFGGIGGVITLGTWGGGYWFLLSAVNLRFWRELVDVLAFIVEIYVSLRLRVQNAVPAQPCVGKIQISLVLLNFLHCNFRLWFETP